MGRMITRMNKETPEQAAYTQAVAAAIRGKMAERQLRQVDVAQSAGLHENTFRRYYRGERPMPASLLFTISAAMDVPAVEIIKSAEQLLSVTKEKNGV